MQGIKVWPDAEAAGSYDGEVSYLTNWLSLRIAYLDGLFNGKTQTSTTLNLPGGTLRNNSPATLAAQVTGKSSLSGSISFLSNGILLGTGALSGNSASLTTSNLPVGTGSLQAIYSGDPQNALSASTPQSVTVAAPRINTATSLAIVPTALNQNTPAGFTVSVLGNSGTTVPTGAVAFMVGSISLGSSTLAGNGTASLSALLPVGVDSITAVYSGDATYQGSTSNLVSINVVGVPDFTLDASPSLAEIFAGKPAKIILTLTPQYGFNQMVSFACSGQTAGASCSFSPATVTLGNAPVDSTLTVSFVGTGQTSLLSLPLWSKASGCLVVALLVWPFRRRRLRLLLAVAAMLTVGLLVDACGTTPDSVAYQVTITASGGGISHTASVSLVGTR
jgi:hypothetical protein